MSYTLFGERYFATRERLAAVMRGVAELATETHTDLGGQLPIKAVEHGLGNPFLFVVCGEVNAGKSTFINGLFGNDLCPANVLPETAKVMWYQHGPEIKDIEITPLLEQRHRPIDFLRDFNLIDTPGTNSVVQGHQEITARFLSAADLVLFVFPVTNPWGAATWNFLSDLPENIRQRVAFIIQQADQRDPIDIEVILGHMADLSLKRIGQVPPIFPVSGKLALEAKRATPLGDRQMKASGFPALESFISKTVCESPERKQTLRAWRSQAASALRMVENRIEFQTDTLTRHGRFLDDIEREIDGIREGFVVRLPTHLTGVAETFESEAVWVTKRLARSLSPLPTFIRLITGDRTGAATEAIFIERLQGAVEVVAESDALELGNVCRSHWLELTVKVRESIGVELGSQDSLDESLAMARSRFVSRLGREARRGIGNLKVRNQLDKDLRRRNLALKSFAFMTLILITIGASSGALEIPWLPLVFSLAALVFLVSGLATAVMTEQRISADFQKRLLDTCGSFAATLRNDYEDALRTFFRDYATSLTAVKSHLAAEKIALEPRLRRWQDLFLTLKAIEQDL